MTTTYRSLFDTPARATIPPVDPNVSPADVKRLAGQSLAILQRLQRGPATNVELARISLKYTSRVSDLRAAGYVVECERREKGLTVYRLLIPQS